MADVGMAVAVCPSAALSMRQLDQYTAPVHNSIPNVPEMLEAGVTVGLGLDNVCDYYMPFVDGDFWTELRMLQEACRFYNFDALVMAKVKPNRQVLMKSLASEFFAVHEANRLVKKGMPFRDAYQQIKENIHKLKVGNPVKAIKEVISIGGPGNLQLSKYKISKPL